MSAKKKAPARSPAKATSSKAASTKAATTKAASTKAGRKSSARKQPHPHASLLDELVQRAKAVRDNAYAPYSRYSVGAAIATKSGRIFDGCNVENASLGATICAERGAIMQIDRCGRARAHRMRGGHG